MDLRARLDGYEVTALPGGRAWLRLVWSEPEPDNASAAAEPPSEGPRRGALAVLDDYRITRIPGRAAS